MINWFSNQSAERQLWIVIAVCAAMLLPFIGLCDFSSNDESKDALVALSMLTQDNYLLPTHSGGDISCAPPFFHWCVALFASLGGVMNEFVSRLPSALALIALCGGIFVFFRKRRGIRFAILVSVISLTSFEMHRTAGQCASDMLFSALMALGSLWLLSWSDSELRWDSFSPWLAILCFTAATLTKGLTGILLPLLAFVLFLAVRREKPVTILIRSAVLCALPVFAYFLWRYFAYQAGGSDFADLLAEDRDFFFSGTMEYEKFNGSPFLNLAYIAVGLLPWSFFLIVSLFFRPWRFVACNSDTQNPQNHTTDGTQSKAKELFSKFCNRLRAMDSVSLFSIFFAAVVLIYFCIPSAKRGVFLMPAYPFLAYLIAKYIMWCADRIGQSVRIFTYILCGIALLLVLSHLVLTIADIPVDFFTGERSIQKNGILKAICDSDTSLMFLLLCGVGLAIFYAITRNGVFASAGMSAFIFLFLNAFTIPTIRNADSLKWFAEGLNEEVPYGYIYSFMPSDMDPDLAHKHYFDINYYTNDRIRLYIKDRPPHGLMLIRRDYLEEYRNGLFLGIDFRSVMWTDRAYGDEDDVLMLVYF